MLKVHQHKPSAPGAISSAEKRRRVVGSAIERGVNKESGNGGWGWFGAAAVSSDLSK